MRVIITAIVMIIMCIIITIVEYKETKKRKKFNEELKKFREKQHNQMINNAKK